MAAWQGISANPLKAEGAKRLGDALARQSPQQLRVLDVSNTQLTSKAASDAPPPTNPEKMAAAAAPKAAAAAKGPPRSTSGRDLHCPSDPDEDLTGLQAIMNFVKNSKIDSLDLSKNGIGIGGMRLISKAFNSNLKELVLRENPLNSLHWDTPDELRAAASGLWMDTPYDACVFQGTRRKRQLLRHQICQEEGLAGRRIQMRRLPHQIGHPSLRH